MPVMPPCPTETTILFVCAVVGSAELAARTNEANKATLATAAATAATTVTDDARCLIVFPKQQSGAQARTLASFVVRRSVQQNRTEQSHPLFPRSLKFDFPSLHACM
jgi:hypothetical protein